MGWGVTSSVAPGVFYVLVVFFFPLIGEQEVRKQKNLSNDYFNYPLIFIAWRKGGRVRGMYIVYTT